MVELLGWNDTFYGTEILYGVTFLVGAKTYRELGSDTANFVFKYKLAGFITFLAAMLLPGVFVRLCMGEQLLNCFLDFKFFVWAAVAFGAVFFSPRDYFWRACSLNTVSLVLDCLRDVERVLAVYHTSNLVYAYYPYNYFTAFFVALVRNSLYLHSIIVLDQLVRGDRLKRLELKYPSFTTKIVFFCCLAYNYVKFLPSVNKHSVTLQMLSDVSEVQQLRYGVLFVVLLRLSHYLGYDIFSTNNEVFNSVSFFHIALNKLVNSVHLKKPKNVNTSLNDSSSSAVGGGRRGRNQATAGSHNDSADEVSSSTPRRSTSSSRRASNTVVTNASVNTSSTRRRK